MQGLIFLGYSLLRCCNASGDSVNSWYQYLISSTSDGGGAGELGQ